MALSRSVQRKKNPDTPCILTSWKEDSRTHELSYSHLQEKPYFYLFDRHHFFDHLLPAGPIQFRDNSGAVEGKKLSLLIEQVLIEVKNKNSTFTDFDVLKRRDFNQRDCTGVLILKFKQYPFVLKLFIETPASMVEPHSKGFEPNCFFVMGGGVNRHLNGFTRIKNLHYLRHSFAQHPSWGTKVDFPRKWFWIPEHPHWIQITGYQIGNTPDIVKQTEIPAIYALVCDFIDVERVFSLKNADDRTIAMELSNYVRQCIDPHINNYTIERHTGKMVLLDTEHFPTMVGYDNPPHCTNYIQWYTNLALKMLKDCIGTTRKERKQLRRKPYVPSEPV